MYYSGHGRVDYIFISPRKFINILKVLHKPIRQVRTYSHFSELFRFSSRYDRFALSHHSPLTLLSVTLKTALKAVHDGGVDMLLEEGL